MCQNPYIMVAVLDKLGQLSIVFLSAFGEFWQFVGATVRWFLQGLHRGRNWMLVLPQAYAIGVQSVGVVAITGGFIGMILAVQTVAQFQNVGLEEQIGAVINIAVITELGPVLAGVMLAGRVGGALTAELGTMNVTEQIDALRVMGADPIRYLVVPRVVACVLLTPFLTVLANFVGVVGGAFVCTNVFDVAPKPYWDFSAEVLEQWDLWTPLVKAMFFGAAIGWISCFKGFKTSSGAEGVGRACTEAFVASFISILVLDFFFGLLLKSTYELIYGPKSLI